MKKKLVAIILIAVIAASAVFVFKSGILSKSSGSSAESSQIYVTPLSEIMGGGSSYTPDVFMGVVEGQETTSITKSSERELDQIFVSEGDTVTEGTPLFSYKTDSLEAEIVQFGFDIEGYNLTIENNNRQIEKLTADIAKIKGQTEKEKNEKEDLQNQINGLTTDNAITNNSIERTKAKIEENNKKINPYTTDGAFITILASKEMRVKGQINEQNVWAINVDEPVTLRSRVDESKTWSGTITKIDTESKEENNENNYGGDSAEGSSTKYPFYVTLDNSEGLMMGQHLYIEIGQTDAPEMDFSDGTYIYDYYIAYDEDGNPFVWVDNNGKLAKKSIELGDYFEEQMVYEVSGIDKDVKLAYPMEDYSEGMKTVSGIVGE